MLTLLFYPLGTNSSTSASICHLADVNLLVELVVAGALEEILSLGPALVVALMRVGAFKLPLTTLDANDKSSACFSLIALEL